MFTKLHDKKDQSIQAFTLVELMITVAIIAMLSAIVLSNFTSAKARSRDAKRIVDINQIQGALQFYFDRCGQYPDNVGNIPNVAATNGCPSGVSLQTFISKIPTPPSGTADSTYRYIVRKASVNRDDFYLGTLLEQANQVLTDDVDGTVGDGTNWDGYTSGTFDATDNVYAITSR